VPLVTISVVSGWSPAEKRAISDAVHAALVEAFRIPEDDYNHRIAEYAALDFIRPAGRSARSVLIEMTVFPGRSREAKRALYREIVERLSRLGVPAAEVLTVLHEPPLQNWGVRGGIPADEADIGFKLDV
jgi:phenylpyruvate tautomerase PptA (4-oxalocrotonate tautomerase family)